MTRARSLIRIAAAATALLGGFGLAAPAAAQAGGIGTGSGRGGAMLALVVGLMAMVLGRLALARSRRSG
jgi:hypothetical protein